MIQTRMMLKVYGLIKTPPDKHHAEQERSKYMNDSSNGCSIAGNTGNMHSIGPLSFRTKHNPNRQDLAGNVCGKRICEPSAPAFSG